jgi:glycerol 3-phosphatase-2
VSRGPGALLDSGAVLLPPAVAVDLDGVIWRGTSPIAGSAEAIARLRAAGVEVVFVTNNAGPVLVEHEEKLAEYGIEAEGAVVSSPMGAATLLHAGERVLAAGGPGVTEAIVGAGATPVTYEELDAAGAPTVEAVVVGYHREFDYDRMRIASTAVRAGARFIATNDDSTYPMEGGVIPGNGAIVAGIATAAGVAPIVAGKPYEPLAVVVRDRCGPTGMMIGDRMDTDGLFATTLGWDFGLVLSGVVTAADLPVTPTPALIADDLAALVAQLLP